MHGVAEVGHNSVDFTFTFAVGEGNDAHSDVLFENPGMGSLSRLHYLRMLRVGTMAASAQQQQLTFQ